MSASLQIARILVGIDFDDPSAAAVSAASVVAEAFGATVTLVHAGTLEVPQYFTEAQLGALEEERRQLRTRIGVDMRAFAARYSSLPVQVAVEEAPAADAILRLAPAFDLVVLGTHRLRGARRWWLGSVAEAVVRRASVPVLVAPVADSPAHGLRRDGTVIAPAAANRRATEWLAALTRTLHVTVVHTPDIATCTPDRLRPGDLLVVPLPSGGGAGAHLDAISHVLKECPHPVLFIPDASPSTEGSPP